MIENYKPIDVLRTPFLVKVLNYLGKDFLEVKQNFRNANFVSQDGMSSISVEQPYLKAITVSQKDLNVGSLNQILLDAGVLIQSGSNIKKTIQAFMKVELLKTYDPKKDKTYDYVNYGDWNISNAKIDQWDGDWIYFNSIKRDNAKLPDNLKNVVDAQEILNDLKKYILYENQIE
ncbi:MAG: hypothetical protein K0B02_01620 [DPANN group archaeon]|nr:hypothetical protein [DPANN group archaeon]